MDNLEYWQKEEWLKTPPLISPEERAAQKEARFQEKLDKKVRKGHEIPKYIKDRKEGMSREKQIQDRWNATISGKKQPNKKFNVKQRLDFDIEEEEPETPQIKGIEMPANFSTDAPVLKRDRPSYEAKRQPNSGAMWHAKGDITFEHALMEVKERGTVNSRGQKTISIPKEWLDKQADEAFQEGKPFWYLAFAYKGSEDVYVIKPYDDEIEMVSELRRLQAENKTLRDINQQLGENKC